MCEKVDGCEYFLKLLYTCIDATHVSADVLFVFCYV